MKSSPSHVFFILLVALLLIREDKAFSQAPSWMWATTMGSNISMDYGMSIATDAAGSVYTTGMFFGTVDFDPGPGIFNLTSSSGLGGCYISKLDNYGNLEWAYSINDSSGGSSIAVDAGGNVYTAGWFSGTADFDPGPGIFNLTSDSNSTVFITKTDNGGNFIWAKKCSFSAVYGAGYLNNELIIKIDTGSFEAVYIAGSFHGTGDFDPDTGVAHLTSASSSSVFICKLDASGRFIWARAMGGGLFANIGRDIAIDPLGTGAVYITGEFSDSADFDPGPGVYTLTGGGAFISKLDSLGNFVWAKKFVAESNAIAMDPNGSGDLYTTGYFGGTQDFNPDSVGVFNMTSLGSFDVFILKLNSSGNLIWAKQMGGGTADYGMDILIDHSGQGAVYSIGTFAGVADFDPGPGIQNLSFNGIRDIYVSKLDSAGSFIWAKPLGGNHEDYGTGIALDPLNNVLITGYYRSPNMVVGPTTLTNSGGANTKSDIFIAKLNNLVTGIEDVDNMTGASIYPNPAKDAVTVTNFKTKIEKTELYNVLGEKLFERQNLGNDNLESIDISNLMNGMYFLKVFSQMGGVTLKFVKE